MTAQKVQTARKTQAEEPSAFELLRFVFSDLVREHHERSGMSFRWSAGSKLDQTAKLLQARGLLTTGLDADGLGISPPKPGAKP